MNSIVLKLNLTFTKKPAKPKACGFYNMFSLFYLLGKNGHYSTLYHFSGTLPRYFLPSFSLTCPIPSKCRRVVSVTALSTLSRFDSIAVVNPFSASIRFNSRAAKASSGLAFALSLAKTPGFLATC